MGRPLGIGAWYMRVKAFRGRIAINRRGVGITCAVFEESAVVDRSLIVGLENQPSVDIRESDWLRMLCMLYV